MAVINDHKIEEANFKQTPNVAGGANNPQRMKPDMIVIHYTASRTHKGALAAMMGGRQVSAHLLIDTDGTIYQLSDLNTITWHAGVSEYGGRKNLNNCSIGIEVVNVGFLKKVGEGKFVDAYQQAVDPSQVYQGKHRNKCTTPQYWYKYPQVQVEKIFEVCEAICQTYDIQYIVGHEEIAPCRKQDPGPAFPLDELRRKLLSAIAPNTKGTVKNQGAGIYIEADENSQRIEDLDEGEEIRLQARKGDWLKVKEKMQGWVATKFIEDDGTDDEWDAIVSQDNLNFRATPGGAKLAKTLNKGHQLRILGVSDEWTNVEIDIEGWVHKNDIELESEG
jgi:N-acetylmuramoyl-L-alanine amidase